MLSVRRLKPGSWDEFREAWDPGDETQRPPGLERVIHGRNVRDEDEVVSFGIFDMTEEEYSRWRTEHDSGERDRQEAMAPFVESESVSGVYEAFEVIED
jgi:hypothetical protein